MMPILRHLPRYRAWRWCDRRLSTGRAGLAAALALGLDREAAAEFRTQRIDAVFESARFFGWRLPYPAVAWFPDFQHRRLPQLFPGRGAMASRSRFPHADRIRADRHAEQRKLASRLQEIYPGAKNEVCVVRFATEPSPAFLTANPAEVVAQYQLPEKYFYLPNQFYTHKNHQVVVDALTILAQRGFDVVVCASGSTEDRRERGYFEQVMAQVRSRGLEKRFRHLGMIPLSHVYALLRACTGLINPSRSEGWSTTVEEAKSFGVPMILSDLDVHREQTAGTASYFGPDDACKPGRSSYARSAQGSAGAGVRNLVPGHDDRVAAFAADFAEAVRSSPIGPSAQVMRLNRLDRAPKAVLLVDPGLVRAAGDVAPPWLMVEIPLHGLPESLRRIRCCSGCRVRR